MPKSFSAFTSEVFRPLVTLSTPGAIAVSTRFVCLVSWTSANLEIRRTQFRPCSSRAPTLSRASSALASMNSETSFLAIFLFFNCNVLVRVRSRLPRIGVCKGIRHTRLIVSGILGCPFSRSGNLPPPVRSALLFRSEPTGFVSRTFLRCSRVRRRNSGPIPVTWVFPYGLGGRSDARRQNAQAPRHIRSRSAM